MANYRELEQNITELLRLEQYPVAWKFVKDENELKGVALVKKKIYSCQMLKIASTGGYVVGATEEELACIFEKISFGMAEIEEESIKRQMRYAKNEEIAKKEIELKPKLKSKGIIVGPLSKVRFTPDLIALFVNAWQAMRCVHAYVHETGENINFVIGPNATPCAYGPVYVYNNGKPNLVLPCSGARIYGKFQTDELTFFMPFRDADTFLNGLKATDAKGLKVPLLMDLGYPPKEPKNVFEKEEK